MYNCKQCGNRKWFYEHNFTKSHIIQDDSEKGITPVITVHDEFLSTAEVVCEVCEASSEDKLILDDFGNPIYLEN